jgi:hypothetical protein
VSRDDLNHARRILYSAATAAVIITVVYWWPW